MHTYPENSCTYISDVDDFQVLSIYVAQRLLAKLLQFIGDIKWIIIIIKKKGKKWQNKQGLKKKNSHRLNKQTNKKDAMQTSFLSTKIIGPPKFYQVYKCKITYEKLAKASQSIHLTLLYEEGQWISL